MNGALVSLVQHDDGVGLEEAIYKAFPQQHTIRHVLDLRLRTRAVFKTDGVPNLG